MSDSNDTLVAATSERPQPMAPDGDGGRDARWAAVTLRLAFAALIAIAAWDPSPLRRLHWGSAGDARPLVAAVALPGDRVQIGSSERDEGPAVVVDVKPFSIDRQEVSTRSYRACVVAGACSPLVREPGCDRNRARFDDRPVTCVEHAQASAFCAWMDARLPTETEWEYAARGASGRAYPWGARAPVPGAVCFGRSSEEGPCVGDEALGDQTPQGVLGLAGNVREWTATPYCASHTPERPCTSGSFVVKGGDFRERAPLLLRGSRRTRTEAWRRVGVVGFRCVR